MKLQLSNFALGLLLCLTAAQSMAALIVGRVVGITDGDTITVLDARHVQHKIRLSGIDAPEKSQPFGQRSKENLSAWVFDRHVTVETEKTDRYGRSVGKIVLNGIDINLEQIKQGFAWHYWKYASEQPEGERHRYGQAEKAARAQRAGLWRDAAPVAPWDWRACRRRQPEAATVDCAVAH